VLISGRSTIKCNVKLEYQLNSNNLFVSRYMLLHCFYIFTDNLDALILPALEQIYCALYNARTTIWIKVNSSMFSDYTSTNLYCVYLIK
jgi:hypothetical protein